ncbi:Ankyrin Repeat [Seminavis robusta]|uniref:Ankyrin Repeat n=1 Tax=Seminavis robusta TaxID=568900 RepID=A0A9N8DC22_9STRA|nr:Ankyrin Repeat [Seminavis robusta]|eukprot:Sro75_g041340.1 Ankyrin Repeat (701) ;mRNA; f:88140-90330
MMNDINIYAAAALQEQQRHSDSSQLRYTDQEIFDLLDFCNRARGPEDPLWRRVLQELKLLETKKVHLFATHKDEHHHHRTPLHQACAHDAPVELASALLDIAPDTANWEDAAGMRPLHLACQAGVSLKLAETIAEASSNPKYFTAQDKHGRTPLHVVMDNASKKESVAMVRLLLNGSRAPKKYKDRRLRYPLSCLVDVDIALSRASVEQTNVKERQQNVLNCFDAYIEYISLLDYYSHDDPDRRFFLIMGYLPDWILHHAAISSSVQLLVNKKVCNIVTVASTSIHFACLVSILIGLQVIWSSRDEHSKLAGAYTAYVGASVIILSKVARLAVRISKGKATTYVLRHPSDVADFVMGILVYVISLRLAFDVLPDSESVPYLWSVASVVCVGLAWCSVVNFFRFVSVDFAELMDGILSTLRKTVIFMIAFTIVLLGSAQGMMIATVDSEECIDGENDFCTLSGAMMKTYTMSVGEVNVDDISQLWLARTLFVIFIYGVVVLIANVLAFIIGNDIWRKQFSERDFWYNRIQVLADWASIDRFDMQLESRMSSGLKSRWRKFASIFEDKNLNMWNWDFWKILSLRVLALVAMCFWVIAGFLSFGVLWPPQVREYVFWVNVKLPDTKTQPKETPKPKRGATTKKITPKSTQFVEAMSGKKFEGYETMKKDIKKLEDKLDHLLAFLEKNKSSLVSTDSSLGSNSF